MTEGFRLAADATRPHGKQQAEGFATPTTDTAHQCATFLPRRVLPIVFLPGIMGSNLRLTSARQKQLGKKDNIAWRPDDLGVGNLHANATALPTERQMKLDPKETELDMYDLRGPAAVSGDERHANLRLDSKFVSPLLADDPPTQKDRLTAAQKARQRGWSEVYFKSYGMLLQRLESRLNSTFGNGKMQPHWSDVVGVDPARWQLDARYRAAAKALTEDDLKRFATDCWFPVYAFGYNWLQSNRKSADAIATRIEKLIKGFTDNKYVCERVIVVTHSMGGLVGRALLHPDMGNLQDKIAGIVHGVMPATGAAAGYKRILAGFEDPGMFSLDYEASGAAKVIGNHGDEVTAVLANAPGGLQLLPGAAYGNDWLQVVHKGQVLARWPSKGDPYEEIYKVPDRWYSLIRPQWINPSGLQPRQGGSTVEQTYGYLDDAKDFHARIADTYHPCTYAHYGNDAQRPSFASVVWEIGANCADPGGWQSWPILRDDRQGTLIFKEWSEHNPDKAFGRRVGATVLNPISASIRPGADPGDQTVPARSADHQLGHANVKAVFRQTGYEHQGSYKNEAVIAATLYSIVRIALQTEWKCAT